MSKKVITEIIKQHALNLGFTNCGFSKVIELKNNKESLVNAINNGYTAEMNYLQKNIEKRANPELLVENAKTVISVLLSYYPKQIENNSDYVISTYAYGNDYHVIMTHLLSNLFLKIKEEFAEVNGRVFCDSAPVFERAWAEQSGLGWIGKNNLLINPIVGSFIILGEIIIDQELEYDSLIEEQCGACTLCINSCPTNALMQYSLNATKCISYATNSSKSETIPDFFKGKLKNEIYGCDICQLICPYNKGVDENYNKFFIKNEYVKWNNNNWENLTEECFNKTFENTAIRNIGFKRLKRNIDFVKINKP